MGYGKLAKGLTEEEARKKIEAVMPARIDKKEFQAYSESVFIGSYNYPNVKMGVVSPSNPSNPSLMDNPREWYRKGFEIEKIASLRTSLVNSNSSKVMSEKQEIAMAKKPVNIEIELEKKPSKLGMGGRAKPVSNSASLKNLLLGENPSVNRKIEKAYYDTDLKAETAVTELIDKTGVYKLQNAFSAGLLGQEENRKIVPTRWSITAVDDQASKKLRKEVKTNQELGEIRYFKNSYVGNHFHIFLIPGQWEYELLELKRPRSTWNATKRSFIMQNHENYGGRTNYAEETAGAYYAARLGTLEYLDSVNRQAKVLIVRDVRPEYWAPLGVWVIRETVRNSFDNYQTLERFNEIKEILSQEMRFHYKQLLERSKMLNSTQKNLNQF